MPSLTKLSAFILSGFIGGFGLAEDWTQGPGPNFDYSFGKTEAPLDWSVSLDQHIAWKTTLPETGQSTPVISGDRLFLTTMDLVDSESEIGSDIIVLCFSKNTGEIIWKQKIEGGYNTRMSAPFGDASSPAPVTDGKKIWVLNPTGRLTCFDWKGITLWSKKITSTSRTRPVLFNGKLLLHRQHYHPDEKGKFPHKRAESGKHTWTQLQAIDAETGEVSWISECGANMGCIPLLQKLSDGTHVLVVGRGGGHGPPEKPEGISMIRADNGKTLWTLPLEKYMATQTYPVVNDEVLIFYKSEHLWVDAKNGKISRRVSITDEVPVRRYINGARENKVESLLSKKPRSITQGSNLRAGNYHYFRSYTRNYLGRVSIGTGEVEYLELPLSILREPGQEEQVLWPKLNGKLNISASIRPNSIENSRGIKVMGDKRAMNNGWGHIASPIPSVMGDRLYVPIMSGLVFVIQADASKLNESAILATNDLGTLGEAFTRSSISSDGKKLYARTIRQLIAIGE